MRENRDNAAPLPYTLNLLDVAFEKQTITIGIYESEMSHRPSIDYRALPLTANSFFKNKTPEQNKVWIDFAPAKGSGLQFEVVLKDHAALARLYCQYLLDHYLEANNYRRLKNFIRNPEVLLLEKQTERYAVFNKIELKCNFQRWQAHPSLCISFAGKSFILMQAFSHLLEHHAHAAPHVKKVVFNKRIYRLHELPDEAEMNPDQCYPLLNRQLATELGIDLPRHMVKDKHARHIAAVEHARKTLFPIGTEVDGLKISKQWAAVEPGKRLVTSDYKFGSQGTGHEVHQGLRNSGPYRSLGTKALSCFFVYRHEDHPMKERIRDLLFPDTGKTGLADYLGGGVYYKQEADILLSGRDGYAEQVEQAMQQTTLDPGQHYLAIYLSPYNKYDPNTYLHKMHFRIKEVLLQRQVASQTISLANAAHPDAKLYYWLPNIAMAVLAKLGGIPWVLNKREEKSLVVGFGIYRSTKYELQYIGSSFCYGQDGTFEEFDHFEPQAIFGIAAKLEQALKRYKQRHGEPKQLVIHYHKQLSQKEFEPILKKIKAFDAKIPVFVVHVNNSRTTAYFVRDQAGPDQFPVDGSVFALGKNDYLLYINTHHGSKKAMYQPMPVRCYLWASDNSLLNNEEQVQGLLQQVYDFAHLHWRSLRQPSVPVTVLYPSLLASHVAWFEGTGMTETSSNKIWFL